MPTQCILEVWISGLTAIIFRNRNWECFSHGTDWIWKYNRINLHF